MERMERLLKLITRIAFGLLTFEFIWRLCVVIGLVLLLVATLIRWIARAGLNVFVVSIAYLVAPVLPAFAIGRRTLPNWLSWFQTPDNPLDGDQNFIDNVAPFRGVQYGWRQYINRVLWLWRNPSYGFDIDVLGVTVQPGAILNTFGSLPIHAAPQTGWYFALAINPDGSGACQLYAVKRWGNWASRINFGWKLWSAPGRCQFAMTVQPYLTIATS